MSNVLSKSSKTPPATANTFGGNLASLRSDPLKFVTRIKESYGDTVKVASIGSHFWYQVTNPFDVERVLRTNAQNYGRNKEIKELQLFVGNGLVANSNDESWLAQRRLLQPGFDKQHVTDSTKKIVNSVEQMIKSWYTQEKKHFELIRELKRLTLKISGEVFFDVDLLSFSDNLERVINVAQAYVFSRYSHPIKAPANFPTPNNIRFKVAKGTLDKKIYKIIEERRNQKNLSEQNDILSILLNHQKLVGNFNDQQVRDELVSLISAGYDFQAITLAWCWYLLALHPQEQDKAYQQIQQVIGDRNPTEEDISKLTCTKNVLQEAMRLYPAYWMILRRSKEKDQLGDFEIEADKTISLPIYLTQRNPEYWSDPDSFKPDRFNSKHAEIAYLAFGSGPHQCISKHFTLMEMQIILVMLLQKFRFEVSSPETVRPEGSINLRPYRGLNVFFTRR